MPEMLFIRINDRRLMKVKELNKKPLGTGLTYGRKYFLPADKNFEQF
jgi:hypothetical protein